MMALDGLEGLCGSTFWDENLTWNTTNPDFTPCFEKTILVWIPCAFIWIFSPLEAYYIKQSKSSDIPWNCLNISKTVLTCFLIVLTLYDFIFAVISDNSYPVDFYSPIIKCASFVLSLIILNCNRTKGICSSGLLFLFWFLLTIAGLAQLRTEVTNTIYQETPKSSNLSVTYIVYYITVVLILFLNFFADNKPKYSENDSVEKECPEKYSSFPSRMLFTWFDHLAILGFRKPLDAKDLWSMNYEDSSSGVVERFEKYWGVYISKARPLSAKELLKYQINANEKNTADSVEFVGENGIKSFPVLRSSKAEKFSVLPALCKAFGSTFLFGAVLKLFQDLLTFVSPQILDLLIIFIKDGDHVWKGYFYAVLLLLTATLQTILLSQYFNRMFLVGLRVRTALISAIYKKALLMSNLARKESTVGEIVNLMSVDAQKFMDLLTYLCMIWSAPLQIFLALFFLWQKLGPSVLAGSAVMIIMIPVNSYIASRVKKLQTTQMKYKDQRVKLMNEVLSGIKVLKLYAWEPSFEEQILRIREKEINVLKQSAYFNASTSFIWACAPFLVSLVTFAVFVLSDENNVLDSRTAFVSLSLFNILRFPLSMLPMLITNMVQASVSIKRINKFMNEEDLDLGAVKHDESETDPLVIENGTFSWGGPLDEAVVLKNINVRIKEGSLVAVVGPVGSGKSSLISAFLGEMERIGGRVNTKGSIAYVPQQAWIQNATLQDNILFGKKYNSTIYNQVVDACALRLDFDMLPAGDQTEIGEKGINLSGGQKQRVSIARAVYNDAEVYFLDDPLSAVDSHVGKHIFEKVIGPNGILRKKTRVLVTHGITYLPEVDNIFVINNGEINEQGTYRELLDKKGAFAEFLMQYLQEVDYTEEDKPILDEVKQKLIGKTDDGNLSRSMSRQRSTDSSSSSSSLQRKKSGEVESGSSIQIKGEKLIETEKVETGGVKWLVYKHYILSIGIFLSVATLFLNAIFQSFSIGSNLWLSAWSSDMSMVNDSNGKPVVDTDKRNMYLGGYAGLGLGQVLTVLLGTLGIFIGTLNAASLLHNLLLKNVFRVPMSFFDVTPSGRILNRFAKDVDTLDSTLPMVIRGLLSCFLSVLSTLVVITYTTPVFLTCVLPIGAIYYFIQRFYVASSRQLKRLESISRSPIYSHFGESVTGAHVIRAYNVQKRFIHESEQRVDNNQICYYPSLIANRWLAVRLETVGNMIIYFSAAFAVQGRDTMNPGLVGLSITYALQITQTLNWLVRMSSDVETNIVAVERIKEYGETPQEAAWEVTPNLVSENWPERGEVEFKNYQLRYRPGLDLVLKGLTFSVKGGEKVGIVGRTGAGKSSLTLGLFRILEAAGGAIFIDGFDISKLGLHVVRSRLTIIPQDPVLFSGTLRINLDPFNKYSDDEIWRALELAHLKIFVKGLTAGLQHEVSEGGDNLSVGQRQLICLARALLRKTKMLVLDEATAAVDLETDDLIQQTIRSEFKDCTVLTIAHRLNTIMDSDRVLVLDKGKIAEFESPGDLLRRKTSIFYGMAKDAGLV